MDQNEAYFPSDIASHLAHTHPVANGVTVTSAPSPLTLDNLAALNALGGTSVYLTGNDDWTKSPSWVLGVRPDANRQTSGATTCAVVVHDRGGGTVDAFYFYFYSSVHLGFLHRKASLTCFQVQPGQHRPWTGTG